MKTTQDLSGSFFDLQDTRLTKLKGPLAQLGLMEALFEQFAAQ